MSTAPAFLRASALPLLCAALGAAEVATASTTGVQIYYTGGVTTTTGTVSRWDGSTAQTLVTTAYNPRPQGVTVNGGNLYWASFEPGEIWRSDLNGQNRTLLLSRGADATTRQIEFYNGQMYWNEEGTGAIFSANPDGSNVQTVVSGHPSVPSGIWDFVIANNRVYWTSWDRPFISTTALDGSDYRTFDFGFSGRYFSLDAFPGGLLLGFKSGAINSMWRANFDGSGAVQLASVSADELTAVSAFNGRAYVAWTTVAGPSITSHIASVPLSGGALETEMSLTSQNVIWQMDVAPSPGTGAVILGILGVAARRRRPAAGQFAGGCGTSRAPIVPSRHV